jgi:hypothetical protein
MIERRRSQRVVPPSPFFGTVRAAEAARVVDLSVHGAQVEVPTPLRPATECSVSLPTGGGPMRVRAHVRRCRAVRTSGESGLAYRAGLEFVALERRQTEDIEDVIVELVLGGCRAEAR